jgi:hypothetical protein
MQSTLCQANLFPSAETQNLISRRGVVPPPWRPQLLFTDCSKLNGTNKITPRCCSTADKRSFSFSLYRPCQQHHGWFKCEAQPHEPLQQPNQSTSRGARGTSGACHCQEQDHGVRPLGSPQRGRAEEVRAIRLDRFPMSKPLCSLCKSPDVIVSLIECVKWVLQSQYVPTISSVQAFPAKNKMLQTAFSTKELTSRGVNSSRLLRDRYSVSSQG